MLQGGKLAGFNGVVPGIFPPGPNDPNLNCMCGASNGTGQAYANDVTGPEGSYIRGYQTDVVQAYRVITTVGLDIAAERGWSAASKRNTGRFPPLLSCAYDYKQVHQTAISYFTRNGSGMNDFWAADLGAGVYGIDMAMDYFEAQMLVCPVPINPGCLILQSGNSDAGNLSDANAVQGLTEFVIDRWRARMGPWPVVLSLLPVPDAYWTTGAFAPEVNAGQAAVALSRANVRTYSLQDLGPYTIPEGTGGTQRIHLNGDGSVIHGQRQAVECLFFA